MEICQGCQGPLPPEGGKMLQGSELCGDCYLEAVHPKVGKPHYHHDSAGFMRRLKTTYSVIRQEID